MPPAPADPLDAFSPATAAWFRAEVGEPTPAQAGAWDAIGRGDDALIVAPTGSGKTLAAFLWAIDRLAFAADGAEEAAPGTRILYISPLKALGVDVERNLERPLAGTERWAASLGLSHRPLTVGVRSGDTTASERRRLLSRPPDILITTPESLFLMLTAAARETLAGVSTVIVDEIHAVAGTKRGAHLALSLARLDALLKSPAQRIGLSATVEPVEEVRAFLSRTGAAPPALVRPVSTKTWDLSIRMPVRDLEAIPAPPDGEGDDDVAGTIWPHVERQVLDEVEAAGSIIVFTNSRRQAERLTARLNTLHRRRAAAIDPEDEPEDIARAHHGSMSKEHRALIEARLKSGDLRCVVATSSLELGIDMGHVDLVIEIESPFSVSSALQRIGRAGHDVGARSMGIVHPLHAADALRAATTVEEALAGRLEPISMPANALDVLAQHTVSAAAMDDLDVPSWLATVRSAAPYRELPEAAFESVLDLLTGRFGSTAFAQLRARLVRETRDGRDVLLARPGAQRLAVTSGGTIPDRGLYPVYIVGGEDDRAPRRVGELDEEMVHETRRGDVITLGTSSWRVEEITHERVSVSPAFGVIGRVPFWHGESEGRPVRLGRAIGAFARELAGADDDAREARLDALGLDTNTRAVLEAHVDGQVAATGVIPSDSDLIVERFRDELGDWRVIVHCPLGQRVTAPWALVVAERIADRYGVDARVMAADDGLVLRLPLGEEPPETELFLVDPDAMADEVRRLIGSSSLFAARFRECAARALLLPRRDPGARAPLWQQRQRSAQLLETAREHPQFPIMLEAARECLQDVYDLPALLELLSSIRDGRCRVHEVETPAPSPYARSLLLGYVMAFMYDDDTPAAERRGAVLALDQSLLAELLADVPLADLLDPEAIAEVHARLQEVDGGHQLRDAEGLADALVRLGPIPVDELAPRFAGPEEARAARERLVGAGRACTARIGGIDHLVSALDADVVAAALGLDLPGTTGRRVPDAAAQLLRRWAGRRGPFALATAAGAFGLPPQQVHDVLDEMVAAGALVHGRISPGGSAEEWVDAEVLRRIRRASLARAREEIRPVAPAAYGQFLPAWQGVVVREARSVGPRSPESALDALYSVVDQLAGVSLPASVWESQVLPVRCPGYAPATLDALLSAGEAVWTGHGALGTDDAWIRLHTADSLALSVDSGDLDEAASGLDGELPSRVLALLRSTPGALRAAEILRALATHGGAVTGTDLRDALRRLALAGLITCDSFAPVREIVSPAPPVARRSSGRRPPRRGGARLSAALMRAGASGIDELAVATGGRWSAVRAPDVDPSARAAALSGLLLDRHGVVTRGALVLDPVPGGFAALSRVLRDLEHAGQCRRGAFVEGLGPSQFASGGAVDRLRDEARRLESAPHGSPLVLGATDPAMAYGAALPWPDAHERWSEGATKPARRAGALVVLDGGAPAAFIDRAGRHLLTWSAPARSRAVAEALCGAVQHDRMIGQLSIETIDGHPLGAAPAASMVEALTGAGCYRSPRSLRLRTA